MSTEKFLALHFDMKRPMWTRAYMDAMVDRIRQWGFNTIVYEVEDKFRFAKHPAVAHPEAFSPADTADFAQACRGKGVEVVPLVQSLGHAECVVGKPEYAHLRESPEIDDQYDPLSDEAREVILEMFDELIDACQPQEFFHIGGDETRKLGQSPKCAEIVKEIGLVGLYLRHMMPLFEHVIGRGLRPIIWADVVLGHPSLLKEIPRDVVLMDWDYFTANERPEFIRIWGPGPNLNCLATWETYAESAGDEFKAHMERFAVDERTRRDGTFRPFYCTDALIDMGFDVLTAPATRCSGDMYGVGNQAMHVPNSFYFARKGMTDARGTLVTSWTVRHTHPEVCDFGTYAAVHGIRTEGAFDVDAVGQAYTKEFFGAEMPEFSPAVMKAQQQFGPGRFGSLCLTQPVMPGDDDPLAAYVERMDKAHGGRQGAIDYMKDLLSGYAEARETFCRLKEQAVRNARTLDFWIEAVDLDTLHAEVLLARLEDDLPKKAPALLSKLEALRSATRELFAETYEPKSVEAELTPRYAHHEQYLRSVMERSD